MVGNSNKVVVGRATMKVCLKTTEQLRDRALEQNTTILLPAGYSQHYGAMMNVAMRNAILEQGVSADEIRMLEAPEFTTAGETVAVARYLGQHYWQKKFEIILVVRWWHASRAQLLLKHFLKTQGLREHYSIEVVRVRSWDIMGMILEPFARIKNNYRVRQGFNFRTY